MKIIILGAGQVGGTVAANLTSEDNDITVVDRDAVFCRGCRTAWICGRSPVMPLIRRCLSVRVLPMPIW